VRALAVEDTDALAGFAPAATGVLVRQLGGPARSDAIASLVIGLLLGVTATGLAWPLADLLIGRSLPPDRLRQARDIRAVPGVDEALDVSRVDVAPQEAMLAAKAHQTATVLARWLDEHP